MRRIIISSIVAVVALFAPVGVATASASAPAVSVTAVHATTQQQQAARMAREYLDYSAFSRKGLIRQLKYEGFSSGVATRAVDSLHVNWKKQAARMAKEYLAYSSFSKKGLIHQLKYEGFTAAQATYGANKAF